MLVYSFEEKEEVVIEGTGFHNNLTSRILQGLATCPKLLSLFVLQVFNELLFYELQISIRPGIRNSYFSNFMPQTTFDGNTILKVVWCVFLIVRLRNEAFFPAVINILYFSDFWRLDYEFCVLCPIGCNNQIECRFMPTAGLRIPEKTSIVIILLLF